MVTNRYEAGKNIKVKGFRAADKGTVVTYDKVVTPINIFYKEIADEYGRSSRDEVLAREGKA